MKSGGYMQKTIRYFFGIKRLHPHEAFILGSLLTIILAVFVMCGWLAWENMLFLGWN